MFTQERAGKKANINSNRPSARDKPKNYTPGIKIKWSSHTIITHGEQKRSINGYLWISETKAPTTIYRTAIFHRECVQTLINRVKLRPCEGNLHLSVRDNMLRFVSSDIYIKYYLLSSAPLRELHCTYLLY